MNFAVDSGIIPVGIESHDKSAHSHNVVRYDQSNVTSIRCYICTRYVPVYVNMSLDYNINNFAVVLKCNHWCCNDCYLLPPCNSCGDDYCRECRCRKCKLCNKCCVMVKCNRVVLPDRCHPDIEPSSTCIDPVRYCNDCYFQYENHKQWCECIYTTTCSTCHHIKNCKRSNGCHNNNMNHWYCFECGNNTCNECINDMIPYNHCMSCICIKCKLCKYHCDTKRCPGICYSCCSKSAGQYYSMYNMYICDDCINFHNNESTKNYQYEC